MLKFNELGLSNPILQAVENLGFVNPTPIQELTIPILLKNQQDLIALAQTGTGKTAAFGLPLIQLIDDANIATQALVLAPTRELCVQIANDLKDYGAQSRQIKTTAVYGGASIKTQIDEIKRGVHIIVATPGRLIDLLTRKVVKLQNIRFVVLDEADVMLDMGFQDDLDEILSTTPAEKHTWLFSATMPDEIRKISKKYMNKPHELTVGTANQANVNIEHQYFVVQSRDKYLALKRILDYTPEIFGIIFCRTKLETQQIAEDLIKDGYNADSLHGDLSQMQRDKVMGSFKSRVLQILVATDVAARGIDVDDVTHIIHLHLPDDMDFYTHRSGRTARAGKSGISMVLITDRDTHKIKQLEKKIHTHFERKMVPTGIQVCEKQLLSLIHRVHDVEVNNEEIAPYINTIKEEFSDMSKEEILTRFAALEFNRFLEYYRFAKDLNVNERAERRGEGNAGGSDTDRFFINLGKMDNLEESDLRDLIAKSTKLKSKEIENLKLKGAYSFFETSKNSTGTVLLAFKTAAYQGRKIRVEVQNERPEFHKKRRDDKKQGGFGDRPKKEYSYGDGNRSSAKKSQSDRKTGYAKRKEFDSKEGGAKRTTGRKKW